MKTSLVLDERVYSDAKKESKKTGRSLGEIISSWAALGCDVCRKEQGKIRKAFRPLDLGEAKIDLTQRKNWVDVSSQTKKAK